MKNMHALFAAALVTAGIFVSSSAAATTLTFEGFENSQAITDGYGGLDWTNFNAANGDELEQSYGANGYTIGAVSPVNTAYNTYGDEANLSGGDFTLNSGFFTAAWRNALTVTVTGYVGDDANYSKSFTIDTYSPTLETFNWTNLSDVTFSAEGGTNPGYEGDGTHFALDNLTVNEAVAAVPETATWLMMTLGFGGIGGAMRRAHRKSEERFTSQVRAIAAA